MILVLGVFNIRDSAENAFRDLDRHKFQPENLSLMTKNKDEVVRVGGHGLAHIIGGALSGITTTSAIGLGIGIIIGFQIIPIPAVNNFLTELAFTKLVGLSGPLAAIISSIMIGALTGGILGTLIGLGLPEEREKIYEERLSEGGAILAVPAADRDEEALIKEILEKNDASQIRTLGTWMQRVVNGENSREHPRIENRRVIEVGHN